MLFNKKELQTMCLTKKSQKEYAAQVINQLRNDLNGADEFTQLATVRAIRDIVNTVDDEVSAACVAACHAKVLIGTNGSKSYQGADGKRFEVEGNLFKLQSNKEYNFRASAAGTNYVEVVDKIERLKKEIRTLNNERKAIESRILFEHPFMAPVVIKEQVLFEGTKMELKDPKN